MKKPSVSEPAPDDDASKPTALLEWLSMFKEWNPKTKATALEQILELCDHTHIKHVHNYIEPKLQRDYISELPREVILHLLKFVRPKDLYKLAQVSSYWYQIANDPILWKNLCKKAGIMVDPNASVTYRCCEYQKSINYQVE